MRFMKFHYVKRYRMELDLHRTRIPRLRLPMGYRLVPWHASLVDEHAEVKYLSFRDEMDAQVFPCLADHEGCQRLMSEIKAKEGFIPEATWLIESLDAENRFLEYCGTIQAVQVQKNRASIQNIGVLPEHRGRGLGTALILAAAMGLTQLGVSLLSLEVTAENQGAVRLYRRLGFRTIRTLYKSVELAYSAAAR